MNILSFNCSLGWITLFEKNNSITSIKFGKNKNKGKNQNPEEIVQGIFALKHLVLFCKCTNLCNSIEMYLKNDYPLIIKYTVASLGEIKLCLAPKCDE